MSTLSLSSGTTIDEIADRIYRISTPVEIPGGGGFSFNQYLIDDDEPLLFHTGLRRLFPVVREAVERIMPIGRLRYVGFSHFEADECGALNEFLAAAPRAEPLCGQIAAMVSVNDYADRPPRALDDGETIWLGQQSVRWLYTPHLRGIPSQDGLLLPHQGRPRNAGTPRGLAADNARLHARQCLARRWRGLVARARRRRRTRLVYAEGPLRKRLIGWHGST
jgi:ODP family beta-lactamase